MRDIEWRGVSMPSFHKGTDGMKYINQALATAQDGLTKHQEDQEKNIASERAANTALVLKMKGEGKTVSDDFLKKLGVYSGKEINEGSAVLRKEEQQNLKNAAQIANWQSGINRDNAHIKQNTLENQLASYGAKLALDKKFGVDKSSRGYSSKKGSKTRGTNYDPFKMNEYIEARDMDGRSKDMMRQQASQLADAGFGNQEIMEELRNGTTPNYISPYLPGGDSDGEYYGSSDPDWLSKTIERRKIRKGL